MSARPGLCGGHQATGYCPNLLPDNPKLPLEWQEDCLAQDGSLRGTVKGSGRIVLQEGDKPRNDVADKMGQLMERWEKSISPTNRRFSVRTITTPE